MAEQRKQSFVQGAAVLAAAVLIVKIIGAIYKIPLYNLLGDDGTGHFNKAYEEGVIDKVFATNLVYRRPELLQAPWFADVNMCKFVALLIDAINHDASLSNLINPTEKIKRLLKAKEDIDL